jgi:adenine-specific DNA-methyltransferase
MAKKIESIKHKTDTRAHIPSKEEAGYEDANAKVSSGKKVLELPKNPVVHRGQDPELFWLNKYGNDDRDDLLRVDIRSLYRHEHIAPETLIKNLYNVTETQSDQIDLFSVNELFGNALDKNELEKVSEYYHHQDGWTNRLIQGDSHLVMASLLEREGMAGQVQSIYIDPPYGINYSSNWQVKISDKKPSENNSDDDLTGEPEVIKAFRDTWELGIHSYLSYLRDRILIAKELLSETGSCFVQINDENSHLVKSVLDEIFGSDCFVITFPVKKKGGQKSALLNPVNDYLIWYAKSPRNSGIIKYRQLFEKRNVQDEILDNGFSLVEINGKDFRINDVKRPTGEDYDYLRNPDTLLADYPSAKIFKADQLQSGGVRKNQSLPFEFKGKFFKPKSGNCWKTTVQTDDQSKPGMQKLAELNRFYATENALYYRRYLNDFGFKEFTNWWDNLGGVSESLYVVQTNEEIIKRCILMTTDPGDLVLDPTCGSGTTAFVAEKWGRRWITIDTSRIALNIAKNRMMTAVFPYYKLYDNNGDIRNGFEYKKVPHVTLGNLANNEPTLEEVLFDSPVEDKKLLRVSGPFTVETLQNFEPISPEDLDDEVRVNEEEGAFEEVIKQHLLSAGIKNGRKNEMVVFRSVESLAGEALHAEGYYVTEKGEEKAYFHIGPKFGTVSKKLVSDAIKECRQKGDANWLVILGFSFESDIEGGSHTTSMGNFEVTKVRIHDDLLQEGLKKKPAKSAASFVTIGEPDIDLNKKGNEVTVEIKGLDIYDPIKDEVKARNVSDIAYWMVDDDYDGSNFVVKQVFFCGGEKDAFAKWKKGLDNLAKDSTKKKVEKTLKIEIDDEAFDRLYGHISHPIEIKKNSQKIAVRIISQFGEECTKVLSL